MPGMDDVFSSHVAGVGYDPMTRELKVRWKPTRRQAARGMTGKLSVYADVPPHIGEQAGKAWSVGQFIETQIKGVFAHRYEGEGGSQ